MELNTFIETLASAPERIKFEDTMQVIEQNYSFDPTEFTNGSLLNQAGQNSGSCKIFAFGLLHELSVEQTLACFGDFYRKDVLQFPGNDDHQNIRNFMVYGWSGIEFAKTALVAKEHS